MLSGASTLEPDYKSLFECLPGLFLILDRNFCIVAASDAYLAESGLARSEIIGQGIFDLHHHRPGGPSPAYIRSFRSSLERVLRLGVEDAMPFQASAFFRPEGRTVEATEKRWRPVNSPIFDSEGHLAYIAHRILDAAETRRLLGLAAPLDAPPAPEPGREAGPDGRKLLDSIRELTALNQDLSRRVDEGRKRESDRCRLLGEFSHELRSPLTLMLAPLEALLEMPAVPPLSVWRPRVEMALGGARRMHRMAEGLLDFCRLEQGRQRVAFEAVDLADLTARLASHFEPLAAKAGLAFDIECHPLPEPVYVNRAMWEKIVLNLLSNAFKYTLQGRIRIALRNVGGHAELRVEDTGVGISEEELPALFEGFRKTRAPGARSHEGAGLGLALVREMVHLHSGNIDAFSQPGQGATFLLRLPYGMAHVPPDRLVAAGASTGGPGMAGTFLEEVRGWFPDPVSLEAPGRHASREGGQPRILVADDNPTMRGHIRDILAAHWAVETARDGIEALRMVRESPPDLVLSDVMMPGLDGLGLVKALRGEPETRSLPILLVTARAGDECAEEGLAAGADDYLVKPFTARSLLARVEAHLRLASLRRQAEDESRLATERLVEANKLEMIGRLSGGIAHDFNNLLTAVNGYADLGLGMARETGVRQCLLEIRAAGMKAAETTKLLLAYGRRQFIHPERLDLNSVVRDLAPSLRKLAGERIRVVERLDPDLEPVLADRDQMVQVIMNLAMNARDAMEEGGGILSVETANCPSGIDPGAAGEKSVAGRFIRLHVSDTGIGIDPGDLERIFEPYYTTKALGNVKGKGLGLPSVMGVVRQNHGHIRVRSVPGKGSSFQVFLPVDPASSSEKGGQGLAGAVGEAGGGASEEKSLEG